MSSNNPKEQLKSDVLTAFRSETVKTHGGKIIHHWWWQIGLGDIDGKRYQVYNRQV